MVRARRVRLPASASTARRGRPRPRCAVRPGGCGPGSVPAFWVDPTHPPLAGSRTSGLPYNLTVFGFRRRSMDFTLSTEEKEVRDWVRTFVRREIIPMEPDVLRRERAGEPGLTRSELS